MLYTELQGSLLVKALLSDVHYLHVLYMKARDFMHVCLLLRRKLLPVVWNINITQY